MNPNSNPGHSSQKYSSATRSRRLPRNFGVLILLTMAQFLILLDYTIVQVALPSIERELGITIGTVQWVVTAYGLTLAGFLLLSGRAGDFYGPKRLFIAGLVLFSLSSLASGLAPTIAVLIVARAAQGIGGAMGSATGLSILVATFPEGSERNRALGIFGAVMGSAFIMGMISGGIITTFLGWRWVFDVTVPIGLTAAALSARLIQIPQTAAERRTGSLDFGGAIMATAGAVFFVYALTTLQVTGNTSLQPAGFLALSLLIFAGFVGVERRSNRPLLPLAFLRRRLVLVANVIALLTVATFYGEVFLLTIYMQQVLNYSPLSAGLAFAPSGLVFFAVSGFFAAKFVNRAGVRLALIVGELLTVAGFVLLTQISASGSYLTVVLPATILSLFGLGFAFPAYSIAALMGARKGEEGLASGLLNTSRQLGAPVGIAILTTVATLLDPLAEPGAQPYVGLVTGFDFAFVVAAALAGVTVFLACLIRAETRRVAKELADALKSPESIPKSSTP